MLRTAWLIDKHNDYRKVRKDIAAVKAALPKVLHDVAARALHIHGSLGTTNLTPLQDMYAGAPTMGLADGPDEVHKATVARRVLKEYRPHDGYFPREYIPYKRAEAYEKFESKFTADPELRESAERYKKYFENRR